MTEEQQKEISNSVLAHQCVRELKGKFPKYSSAQIAKEIGMSQPTFNRIENGQTNPSLNSISKLLSAIGKSHKISAAIEIANPSLASTLKENLSHNLETPLIGGELAKYFTISEYRNILLLALTRSGTTKDEVQGEYGNAGIKNLEEMLKSTLLHETRGIIRANENKVTFDQDTLRDSLVDCIAKKYDAEKFGNNENWLSFQTESVNKSKAMSLIRSKLQRVYKEIKEEILYSPDYYGNDKVFVGMVADSLLKDSIISKEAN
ncbi:MAG: helix-turn-helix transcriptional regulator [Halobacteriovoraceae bacterium]|nr:helix-turn-helix transcriptional regulator [Halobacteriovoraceae bacterium]